MVTQNSRKSRSAHWLSITSKTEPEAERIRFRFAFCGGEAMPIWEAISIAFVIGTVFGAVVTFVMLEDRK